MNPSSSFLTCMFHIMRNATGAKVRWPQGATGATVRKCPELEVRRSEAGRERSDPDHPNRPSISLFLYFFRRSFFSRTRTAMRTGEPSKPKDSRSRRSRNRR